MLLLVTTFALQMFGCGSKQEASSETRTHLNIAIQPVPGYVSLYVLRDKGWLTDALKEDAVDINFTEFESGPPENKSFAAGQQDIGVMGNVPSISGIAAGQNRSIIGSSYNGEQATALTQGQVDAVTTWEPSITKIQSSGDTQILADGTDLFKGENTIVADLQKTADFLYESGTISQQLQIKDSVVKP